MWLKGWICATNNGFEEKFTGPMFVKYEEAEAHLTRVYRAAFSERYIVPVKVKL